MRVVATIAARRVDRRPAVASSPEEADEVVDVPLITKEDGCAKSILSIYSMTKRWATIASGSKTFHVNVNVHDVVTSADGAFNVQFQRRWEL